MEYELIETFRNLSQQIVWVYEEDRMNNNVPDNVMICRTIPNKIALSHKNTAIFVTEDDTNAVKQALHYGIPMLLVPFRNSEVIYTSVYAICFTLLIHFEDPNKCKINCCTMPMYKSAMLRKKNSIHTIALNSFGAHCYFFSVYFLQSYW